jgi:hypothetical protein
MEGKGWGLGIQRGRRGVVWDRQGEEGTELGGSYREKGWEGRKGGEGRRWLDPPPKQSSWIRHCSCAKGTSLADVHALGSV